jgi:hemerythrin-like domain-containing protein
MEAIEVTTQTRMTPCAGPLPDLEVPMINTMVNCLGSEHRRLSQLTLQLAFSATRLASDPEAAADQQRAIEIWEELRQDLWAHLQIEDGLVFSWGEGHGAIEGALLEALKVERQEMRKLIAGLPEFSSEVDSEPQSPAERGTFARTLLALAESLDSHVVRYDGTVLPSILRALFHR